MANVLIDLALPITGGLVGPNIATTAGSPAGNETTVVASGDYAFRLAGAATKPIISYDVPGSFRDYDNHTLYMKVAFSSAALNPTTEYYFATASQATPGSDNRHWALSINASGDLVIHSDAAALSTASITAANHGMVADTFYLIKVHCFTATTTGKAKVVIGDQSAEITNVDTFRDNNDYAFGGPGSGDGTVYLDIAMVWNTETVYEPTDLPEDIAKSKTYNASGTPTTYGDTVTWSNISELPFSTTNTHADDTGGSDFGADCDSTRQGPSGDSDLTGATLIRAIWGGELSRGNGGGTTHTLYSGNTGEGTTPNWYSNANAKSLIYLDTAWGWEFYSENAGGSHFPSLTEDFRIGAGHSGARELKVGDLCCAIVYEPAAAGGSFPPVSPIRNFQHILVR